MNGCRSRNTVIDCPIFSCHTLQPPASTHSQYLLWYCGCQNEHGLQNVLGLPVYQVPVVAGVNPSWQQEETWYTLDRSLILFGDHCCFFVFFFVLLDYICSSLLLTVESFILRIKEFSGCSFIANLKKMGGNTPICINGDGGGCDQKSRVLSALIIPSFLGTRGHAAL